jgi:hypothetical protein
MPFDPYLAFDETDAHHAGAFVIVVRNIVVIGARGELSGKQS